MLLSQQIDVESLNSFGRRIWVLQDEKDGESEHVLIDDIDNNGYLVHDEEEIELPTNNLDGSTRYVIIGKTFDSSKKAYDFYNDYGLSKGFGIRKHLVSRQKSTNEVYRRTFVCNKQGFKDMNDKRRMGDDVQRRSITRTECKAMIQVTLVKQDEWVVDKFHDEHNHDLDLPSHVLKQRSHNVFHHSNECKDVVSLLSKAGMKPSQITKVVNAFRGEEEDRLTRVQCSNIVNNEKKTNLGKECHGIIMHFKEKADLDQDFYFAMVLSTDGTLRNVFWADGRSRLSYCHFGDVVVLYVTYKTNKFSLPFAPFVGVNHHGHSILFGEAFLENETEATFTWLFKNFLNCMHESPPISIIANQDLAMGKAIAKVFPKTRHRYCAWHIKKHVLEHLQPLRSRYGAVSSRRGAEEDQDFRTLNSKPTLLGDHPIEVMAAKCYTLNIYDIFKKEWKASFDCGHEKLSKDSNLITYRVGFLEGNKENWKIIEHKIAPDFNASCSCGKFETFGILCKHILYIMRRKLLRVIPDHYILPRWTMKATNNVGLIGNKRRSPSIDASKEVGLLTLWSIRAKFNKLIKDGQDSLMEIEKIDATLNGHLEEQRRRKGAKVTLDTNFGYTISSAPQEGTSQCVCVSDPLIPARTKGRPKSATRNKSSMEIAIDMKKRRTCSYCKEKRS